MDGHLPFLLTMVIVVLTCLFVWWNYYFWVLFFCLFLFFPPEWCLFFVSVFKKLSVKNIKKMSGNIFKVCLLGTVSLWDGRGYRYL